MAVESSLRAAVLEKLAPLHAVPIESPLEPGTPDVNCSAGWLELKSLREWPKRESSVVVPPHFEPEQRFFLRHRCTAGGNAWLLLRVGREWCLLWGSHAAEALGISLTRLELQSEWAVAGRQLRRYWPKAPNSNELMKALLVGRWL